MTVVQSVTATVTSSIMVFNYQWL